MVLSGALDGGRCRKNDGQIRTTLYPRGRASRAVERDGNEHHFFFYKRPNFSDWIKADRFVVLMTSLSDVEQMCPKGQEGCGVQKDEPFLKLHGGL